MEPNWSFLFVFFIFSLRAFTALFWGIFLFFYRRRSMQNFPLSVIFIVIGFLYLRNGFLRLPTLEACDVYNPLSYIILIFIAPFTIFYAYYALDEKHSFRYCLLHFVPFVFCGCLWIILALSAVPHIPFCYSLPELLGYAGDYPLYVGFFMLLMIVFIGQVFTYFSMALVRLLRIRRNYRAHNVSVRPLKLLTAMDVLFMIYPLVCVVYMSYNNAIHFGTAFNFLVCVIITALAVLNLNLILPVKTDLGFMSAPKRSETRIPADPVNAEKNPLRRDLAEEIGYLFEHQEIYRLTHLTLQDLACRLGTNRSYVSACINNHYGCNFKQLLIRYRMDAAKDLLLNSSLDIQEIIYAVGFNTRASFYRAFKERVCEDRSPTEWRKNHTPLIS